MGDYLHEEHGIYISEADQLELIEPEETAFQSHTQTQYGDLFRQSFEAAPSGVDSNHTFFVPATRFIVAATLRVLSEDSVSCQLPYEIEYRADIAGELAEIITELYVGKSLFARAYAGTDLLTLGNDVNTKDLTNTNHLPQLGRVAFKDAGYVAGGAFKVLETTRLKDEDPVITIQRSTGLLAVGKLDDNRVEDLQNQLGWPYVKTEHLKITDSPEGQKVRFTQAALELLRDYFGVGCPAAMIKLGGNLLQAEWGPLVQYLVPPEATVYEYTDRPTNVVFL